MSEASTDRFTTPYQKSWKMKSYIEQGVFTFLFFFSFFPQYVHKLALYIPTSQNIHTLFWRIITVFDYDFLQTVYAEVFPNAFPGNIVYL